MTPLTPNWPHLDARAPCLEAYRIDLGEGPVTLWECWAPRSCGVAALDYPIGREHADAVLECAHANALPRLPGAVVDTIMSHALNGRLPSLGLEAGFLDRLAELAYCGAGGE